MCAGKSRTGRSIPFRSDQLFGRRLGGSPEQPLRGQPGAVAQAGELRPHHIRGDAPPSSRGIEAAIDAGENARRIADHRCDTLDAVRHHFRMLDEIGQAACPASSPEWRRNPNRRSEPRSRARRPIASVRCPEHCLRRRRTNGLLRIQPRRGNSPSPATSSCLPGLSSDIGQLDLTFLGPPRRIAQRLENIVAFEVGIIGE